MASKTAKKSAVTAPKAERPKLTAVEAIREIRNLRNASPRGSVGNMEYVDLLLAEYDAAQKEIKRLGGLLSYAESRLETIISGS